MKNILKITAVLFFFSAMVTSCIKDKYKIDYDEANLARPVVEITESPTNKITKLSVDLSNPTVVLDLGEIRIAPRAAVSGNVTVTLAQSTAAVITATGAAQSPAATLTPIPNSAWTFVKTSYTLSDGSRVDRIKINFTVSALPSTGRNAIGIVIQSATGAEVSGLYKTLVVELKPKSPYEANYAASGTRTSYNGATVASGVAGTTTISGTKFFSTVSPTQIDGIMADLGFVPFYMTLSVNPVNNNVTVLQSIPNSADTPPTVGNNGSCTYNPITKTFVLNYFYLNGSGNLRQITETLVRQ
jgi:hypothetical protein